MLQPPVAVGNDDVLELQALALVDGEDADAVRLGALDGLGADGLLPFADEGGDVGRLVLREFVQLVVEGADVGTLLVEPLELEDAVKPFGQFVER